MTETGSHVRVGDVEFFVVTVGDGPPLLVIHGGPGLGHSYLRSLDALAHERQVIYYDQRGAGRSATVDPASLTFAGLLEDLEGLRAALGLEQVDLLGHSLGGHPAYLYAARHPDRVRSLLLVDVGPPFDEELGERMGAEFASRRTREDDAARRAIERSPSFRAREPEAVDAWVRNVYTPMFRDRATIGRLPFDLTAVGAPNVVGGEERIMGTLAELDPLGSLARIRCPTLVVHGALDPIPAAFSRLLAATIPGATFALIPEVSHFAFAEDPEPFFATVRAFLAR
jgi:proline iminopeptidase